jgi:hypothetical protein
MELCPKQLRRLGCRLVLVGSPGRYSFDPVEAPVGLCSCASRPGLDHLAVRVCLGFRIQGLGLALRVCFMLACATARARV